MPVDLTTSSIDYLPYQFLTEYVKSKGYDAIIYGSAISSTGKNLALFDAKVAKCKETYLTHIKSVNYNYGKMSVVVKVPFPVSFLLRPGLSKWGPTKEGASVVKNFPMPFPGEDYS